MSNQLSSKMSLAIPGLSSSTAIVAASSTTGTSGRAKLDPRFQAILNQAKVKPEHQDKLGDAEIESAQEFGHIAKNDDSFLLFLKRVCNLDPETRGEDALPVARLTIAWENCKKRNELESEQNAHRVLQNLPPTLSADDHQSAREAWERKLGRSLPDHKVPSEAYLQMKLGEIETVFKAEKLTMVTSLAQEALQKTGQNVTNALTFDIQGHPTLKTQKKEFTIAMPDDESSLRARFEIMGGMLEMLKMRFMANPIVATASLSIMKEYAEFLCGETVWGLVVKGAGGTPLACPHIGHVLAYDMAIRTLQARLMKGGLDFQKALETAMADNDTRTLHFTTAFSIEASTPLCRALSAPGLKEIYPMLANSKGAASKKTEDAATGDAAARAAKTEANRLKRTKKKLKQEEKKAAAAAEKKAAAAAAARRPLAILDAERNPKGKGKGKSGDRRPNPKGIKSKTDENELVCYAHNRGEPCAGNPCNFKHVCWWCGGAHAGGFTKNCRG